MEKEFWRRIENVGSSIKIVKTRTSIYSNTLSGKTIENR